LFWLVKWPFLLFNQQQCFICSTASFLLKLRAKKVEKLHNSSFYRNFRYRERLFPVLSIMKQFRQKTSSWINKTLLLVKQQKWLSEFCVKMHRVASKN
jgi:hypothetical protein